MAGLLGGDDTLDYPDELTTLATTADTTAAPPAPAAVPAEKPDPNDIGWLAKLGLALGGGPSGAVTMTPEERRGAGTHALMNFGLSLLRDSGWSTARRSAGEIVAGGLSAAQEAQARAEQTAATQGALAAQMGLKRGELGLKADYLRLALAKLGYKEGIAGRSAGTSGGPDTGGAAPAGGLTPFVAGNLPEGVSAETDQIVRTVMGEAGGESPEGQRAVAAVILNRAKQSGQTVSDVIFSPAQFEPWNDPVARAKMESHDPRSAAYQRVLANVRGLLDGSAADPTGGATHFYAPKVMGERGQPEGPSWAVGKPGMDIGGHRFLKLGFSAGKPAPVPPAEPGPAVTPPAVVAGPGAPSASPAPGAPVRVGLRPGAPVRVELRPGATVTPPAAPGDVPGAAPDAAPGAAPDAAPVIAPDATPPPAYPPRPDPVPFPPDTEARLQMGISQAAAAGNLELVNKLQEQRAQALAAHAEAERKKLADYDAARITFANKQTEDTIAHARTQAIERQKADQAMELERQKHRSALELSTQAFEQDKAKNVETAQHAADQKVLTDSLNKRSSAEDMLPHLEALSALEPSLKGMNPLTARYPDSFQPLMGTLNLGSAAQKEQWTAARAFQQVVQALAPTVRQKGSGNLSDREMEQYLASLPSLTQTREGRVVAVGMLRKAAELRIEQDEFRNDYWRRYGGMSPAGRPSMNEEYRARFGKRSLFGEPPPAADTPESQRDYAAYVRQHAMDDPFYGWVPTKDGAAARVLMFRDSQAGGLIRTLGTGGR